MCYNTKEYKHQFNKKNTKIVWITYWCLYFSWT